MLLLNFLFETLENYAERASQILGAEGQNVTLPDATNGQVKPNKTIAATGASPVLTLPDVEGHKQGNGGSGGARTRNLCRDRAAL